LFVLIVAGALEAVELSFMFVLQVADFFLEGLGAEIGL
jgi:hypothetical protein